MLPPQNICTCPAVEDGEEREGCYPAVLMHICKPTCGVPISASEDWQVSWTGRLGGQSDVGLPEDPDIFFLSQSATSSRITQWSLLEGTSGDYLVHPPVKAVCARADCTKFCAGGIGTSPEAFLGSLCQ